MNQVELKEILMKIAKNEIRIFHHEQEENLPISCSKIGGTPAVPKDFKWPNYTEKNDNEIKNRPLFFIAQMNLEEIAVYDTEGILPKKGMLSFFYELATMPRGFDPKHKGSAKVYYFPNVEELIPGNIPEDIDKDAIIPEFALKTNKQISLPEAIDFEEMYENIDLDWDEYNKCSAECGYEKDSYGKVTKLLGYPNTIQSPMEEQCEMISRSYYLGNNEDYDKLSEIEKKEIKEKSSEWILLFQMGTIETNEMKYTFGDCGHLYFWIRKKDLENLDFDKIWTILQCY